MTFICRAAQLSARQTECEPYLVRFQVNDSYMAYTNDHGYTESNDNIVLKSGVYAVAKKHIDDNKGEFHVNTRTEWRVVYVDPFSINLALE
jgi:hypothetical protein